MHSRSECEYIDFYTRFLTYIVSLGLNNNLVVVFNLETRQFLTFMSFQFKRSNYNF